RKSRKQRGSRYCGWGQVGQHRKGGMRGGKGKAGGRKHYWIRTVKYEPDRFKKVGFKPPSSLEPRSETVNVGELVDLAFKVLGQERMEGGELTLDLGALGYGKLLGRGDVSLPFKVKVQEYTSSALEKIESAGGQIVEPE
ncbi:MAG: 50S ribosomal protein L15, partial [Candidatus Bathyarchaeota archaeon]|nr:50S ribosomal protein L15 [Candidatus Bathyarchaeota archaeon]